MLEESIEMLNESVEMLNENQSANVVFILKPLIIIMLNVNIVKTK